MLLGVIMSHDGIFHVGVVEEQVMIIIMTWSCDLKCAWLDTRFFSRGKRKYIQKRISSFWHLNCLQNTIFYNKRVVYIFNAHCSIDELVLHGKQEKVDKKLDEKNLRKQQWCQTFYSYNIPKVLSYWKKSRFKELVSLNVMKLAYKISLPFQWCPLW